MAAQVAAIDDQSSVLETIQSLNQLTQQFISYRNSRQEMYSSNQTLEHGCHKSQCEFGCICNLNLSPSYGGFKGHYEVTEEMYGNEITNPEVLVKNLSKCNCCERHKTNKPTNLHTWNETNSQNHDDGPPDCKCNCRHLSRFLCRANPRFLHNAAGTSTGTAHDGV